MKPVAWLLPALLALAAGCATPRDPAKTEIPPGNGLLAVRIVAHVPNAPVHSVGLSLTLQRADGSGAVTVRSTNLPFSSSADILEPLPPGRYRLDYLQAYKGKAPLSSLSGEFEVLPDRVTDLGLIVLVFTNLDEKRETGFFVTRLTSGRFVAVQESSAADTASMLLALTPEMRARLHAGDPLRPKLAANEEANRRVLAAARAFAGIVSSSALAPGQPVAYGRALGQILVWDPGTERWRVHDTGRRLNVMSVAFAADGNLLAGLEEGVVLEHREGAWCELARPGGNGPVEFVGQAPGGEYYALVRGPERSTLLSARDPYKGWTLVRSFEGKRARAWLAAGKLAVIIWPGVNETSAIHVFDPATRQWSGQAAGTADEHQEVLPDGSIVSMRGYNRVVRVLEIRRARGFGTAGWHSNVMDETVSAVFADERTIYRTRLPDSGNRIERSDDGGVSWASVGEAKPRERLLALPKSRWLLSSTPVGELSVSSDDGATWERLRPWAQ